MTKLFIVIAIISTAICIIRVHNHEVEEQTCMYNIKYCPCVNDNVCPNN